jgi:two-component system phosphate regulon response regulator PhoB
MAPRILVVDDEPDLLELLQVNLTHAGMVVETARSAQEAFERLRRAPPDLLVLDLMLPDLSGEDVCRRVRADERLGDLPILMLTAKSDEIDRVVGFEIGADDYLTKPFSPRELVLRVKAVLRRRIEDSSKSSVLDRGELRLELDSHRCTVSGREVELTAKEFKLLQSLMARPGHVKTRDRLIQEVWGPEVHVTLRTVDTHLKRIREKLGSAASRIETVRGVGYRFAE